MIEKDSEERSHVRCNTCNLEMEYTGTFPFVWGTFRDSAKYEVYACPKCREVRLFLEGPIAAAVHLPSQDSATPKSFMKKCVKCGKQIAIASEECPFCGERQPRRR